MQNDGYADLRRGLWFFNDFLNAKDAVCKLGRRSAIVKYQNLGTLYVDAGLKIFGSTPEGFGRLIVNGWTAWDVLPGDTTGHPATSSTTSASSSTPLIPATIVEELKRAVALSDALKAEDAYLTDVPKTHPVASFIGFLALSEAHAKRLFTDFAKAETKAQWTSILSRLNRAPDPWTVVHLLDHTKALLWDQSKTVIGAKALKDYLDIKAVIIAIDEAIVDLLTGVWGLDYLKGITGDGISALDNLATKVGSSFIGTTLEVNLKMC